MGLFDKLFGNKKPDPIKTEPKPAVKKYESASEMMKRIEDEADRKRQLKEEEINRAIANNPGSGKYRLEKQQTESNAHILTVTEFAPFVKERFVVFDLETTGLDYIEHKMAEIGAVRVENGEITAEYSQLINPEMNMSAGASAVNHITDDMLAGKPKTHEVLPAFLSFVGDDVLAAHNVQFDYRFLAQACMVNKFRSPESLFDSMALAKYFPEAEDKKLPTLAQAAGVELETAHRALSDARMTAKLILKAYEKKEQESKKPGAKKAVTKELNLSRCTEDVEIVDNSLAGLRFCVTGGIPGYERPDVERLIKQHSGRMTESISGKTDYLVLGTYDNYEPGYVSNKQKAALDVISNGGKIQIINAEKFFELVNSGPKEK